MRSVARRVGVGLLIAALAAVSVAVASAAVARHPKKPNKPLLSISVLSGRADLVSGGSALVAITLPGRADAKRVEVTVGRRNVTNQFAFRKDGRFRGSGQRAQPRTQRLAGDSQERVGRTDHAGRTTQAADPCSKARS